jgi:hypothetical protein
MHEHPSHELSKQAACSLTTKSYEEPKIVMDSPAPQSLGFRQSDHSVAGQDMDRNSAIGIGSWIRI